MYVFKLMYAARSPDFTHMSASYSCIIPYNMAPAKLKKNERGSGNKLHVNLIVFSEIYFALLEPIRKIKLSKITLLKDNRKNLKFSQTIM